MTAQRFVCHESSRWVRCLAMLGLALLLLLPATSVAQMPEEPHRPRSNWVFKPQEEPAPELKFKLKPEPQDAPAQNEAQPDSDAAKLSPPQHAEAEAEPAPSGLTANYNPSSGPPTALLAEPEDDSYSPSGGYVNKEKDPYVDVFAAWGWSNSSYLVTVCPLTMYLRGSKSRFGFHGRLLAFGALSFEQRNIHADGTSSHERRTTFVVEVFAPGVRIYFADPVFFAFNVDLGMTFYDALVPTLDVQSGLGFDYHGWGLESGVRTSRLPRNQVIVNDDKFFDDRYGLQVYLAVETNLHF